MQVTLKQRAKRLVRQPKVRKALIPGIILLAFAIIGVILIRQSGAATFATAVEAEAGAITGSAAVIANPAGASGSTVSFGQGGGGGGSAATYPLKISANKRYLTGSNGTPYLLMADTAWNLSAKLTDAEATEYLEARKEQGFNTILTSMIDINSGGALGTTNREGAKLFNGNMGAPNAAYFDHVQHLLDIAKGKGMQLAIWASWSSIARKEGSFTPANMTTYGKYLGERFKNSDNIIWVMGGDWGGPTEGQCPERDKVQALANGIKSVDTRHLMTYHPGLNLSSSLCYNDAAWLDVHGTYWDFKYGNLQSSYSNVLRDYNTAPTRPVLMLETGYEGQGGSTSYTSRLQSANQILAGGTGATYGVVSTYEMRPTEAPGWKATVSTRSGWHQGYVGKAFSGRAWWKLVPDQQRQTLTGGNGSYGQQDYASAALANDGTLFMAYAPTSRTLTVNMAKLSNTVNGLWYDPTNGQTQPIGGSPFANTGSRQFQTPGNNSAGQGDWILILETTN